MTAIGFIRKIGLIYLIPLLIYLVNPLNIGFLFGYVLTLYLLLNFKKMMPLLDRDFVFISLFSVIYALFYSFYLESGIQYVFIYAFFPGVLYILGKYLVLPKLNSGNLVFLFFTIAFLFSFMALISTVINLREGGFVQFDRTVPMILSGREVKATLMSSYLTFNMTIPILFLIQQRKTSLILLILAGIIFVASLLSVFRLGSRTQIVICFISIIVSLFYVVPRQTLKSNTRLLFILFVVVLLILKFVPLNLNADYLSVLGERLQDSNNAGSAGGRTELWTKAVNNLFVHPLGWHTDNSRFAHNLWLDVARFAGLIPMTILVISTVRFIRNTLKAVRKNPKEHLLNATMLIFMLGSMLIFFVEPIMLGLFDLFCLFVVFQGMIKGYLEQPNDKSTLPI